MKNEKDSNLLFKLGHKIKYERSKKNITQQYLAELADLSIQAINAIETGKSDVKFTNLYAISQVLGLNLGDFSDFRL